MRTGGGEVSLRALLFPLGTEGGSWYDPPDAATVYQDSASTTSANVDVSGAYPGLRIRNAGTVDVFVKWGKGTQTATTSDYTVLVGAWDTEAFNKGDATNVAAITASGTATVYLNVGEGQ